MKKHLIPLSAIALLAMIGVAACGGNSSSSAATSVAPSSEQTSEVSSESEFKVSITNKEALQATWYVGGANRSVELSLTPTVNILDALADGTLKIESSAPEVVSVNGRALTPVAKGEAKITVTYHDVKDQVEVAVGEATAKEKYGTVHAGTLEDPLDNADAVKVGLWAKDNGDTKEDLYIKGEVERFYEAPGERASGEVSFFLKAEGEDTQFEIYRVMKKDAEGKSEPLTYADIAVGSTVVVYGRVTYYANNKQPETAQGTTFFVSSDHGATEEPKVTEAESVAKVVEAGLALADGASTYDFVKVTGYVVIKDGSNFWLADEKKFDLKKTDLLELYGVSDDDAKICLKGAKITVTLRVKNYKNQIEGICMKDFVEVAKGEPWKINYIAKDVAGALEVINALEDGKTTEEYYSVTGVVVEITSEFSEKFGNMSFTMGDAATDETLLTAFRVKLDAETAAKVVVGETVEIGGKLQKYVKDGVMTPELTGGTVLSIGKKEQIEGTTVDFTTKAASNKSYKGEWAYGDFTLSGGANNGAGWEYVKFGPKAETLADSEYLGSYVKTKALAHAITKVVINLGGAECYRKDSESANARVEVYSDAAFTTKVGETATAVEIPAVAKDATATVNVPIEAAAGTFVKLVFDITNTTTYNGVFATTSIIFAK